MSAVFLARLQFAFAAGFHYLFPPTTFGLTFIILIFESLYFKTKDETYKKISSFLIKILGLVFVVGAATGITLEFAFGTNWSEYSRMVGDIFGAPLAAEGVFAFFMESIFLGILLFGRKKVSPKMYLTSSFLVFFGSHLSGLWIIIANSFMQTPAGYEIVNGRAVLTNFMEAALNHSTIVRYIHVVIAGWITGSLFVAAIGAWYILKKRFLQYAEPLLKISLIVFLGATLLQFGSGHSHSVQVAKTQPLKMAAFEAQWETQKGAPIVNFGIPNVKEEKTYFLFESPKMLSFLVYGDFNAEMKGLKSFPKDQWPPILISFFSYHIMIYMGVWFLFLVLFALYLWIRKTLLTNRWFLTAVLLSLPLPYIANETGWIATEVGRQPWVVYGVLKTADAVSVVVPAWQILLTLTFFILVYAMIFWIFMKLLLKIIRLGPETPTQTGY